MDPVTISALSAARAAERTGELVDLLLDSVANGASVNFLADLSEPVARAFWVSAIEGLADDRLVLLAAQIDGRIVGTVMLVPAPQPNQPHRADVNKLLVQSSARRRGIGAALLAAVEDEAERRDRTLLMLDTVKASDGDRLYTAHGWIRYGEVPGHALLPDGKPETTSFFYKQLG